MNEIEKEQKRRRSAKMQKRIVNPLTRTMMRFGLFPRTYALLETTGRRTGTARRVPVGNGLEGDTFWLVAEHGTRADYVRNLVADPSVRVRLGWRWRRGTATVLPDDDPLARRRAIDRANGLLGRLDGAAFRSNAVDSVTIRIDLEPRLRRSTST